MRRPDRPIARLVVGLGLLAAATAQAQVFKCADARGRIHYGDRPCPGKPLDYKPPELNRIAPERLTGRTAAPKSDASGWVSPLDPVANCRKQGGTFSKEMRGCLLPP